MAGFLAEQSKSTNLGVVEPSQSAKIERIIMSLSPMKSGKTCNYYDGRITNNHSSVRYCGFDVY